MIKLANLVLVCFILFLTSCGSYHSCYKELKEFNFLNKSEKIILCKNPEIIETFRKYDNISDSLFIDVMTKVNSDEYSIKKAKVALDMYGTFGTNWEFDDTLPENIPKIESMQDAQEYIENSKREFENSLMMMQPEIKRRNYEDMSEVEKIYYDTNIPSKLAQENQDSIDYYIQKDNMDDFKNYMIRLKESAK